jgi:hypothetical protein
MFCKFPRMQLTYTITVSIFSVPLDCIVSPWTAWSGPDQTGTYARVRFVTYLFCRKNNTHIKDQINFTLNCMKHNIQFLNNYCNISFAQSTVPAMSLH